MIFLAILCFLISWVCGYFGLHPILSAVVNGSDISTAQALFSAVLLAIWIWFSILAGQAFAARD